MDLPTPPLADETAMIFFTPGMRRLGGRVLGRVRGGGGGGPRVEMRDWSWDRGRAWGAVLVESVRGMSRYWGGVGGRGVIVCKLKSVLLWKVGLRSIPVGCHESGFGRML